MPQNLSQQILQRIFRWSADGNFLREVARMLGVSQRCISQISRVLVCECRWSADLGGRCQFEPFGDGFWPPDNGLGVQSDVPGSLGAQATAPWVGGGGGGGWGVGVRGGVGGGGWGVGGGGGGGGAVFGHNLCTSKTMPRPIQHVTQQTFWTNRMLRSWTGHLRVQTWTQLSMFGIKCQSGSETLWPHYHLNWIKQCCPPGMDCRLARKGADPGRKHASSCQGSSGR